MRLIRVCRRLEEAERSSPGHRSNWLLDNDLGASGEGIQAPIA